MQKSFSMLHTITLLCVFLTLLFVHRSTDSVRAAGEGVVVPGALTILTNSTNVPLSDDFAITGNGDVLVFVELAGGSASTFSISTNAGLTLETGVSSWSNQRAVYFHGSVANSNAALDSLTISTSSPESVTLTVTVTEYDSRYAYLPATGHFYRQISASGIDFGPALTAAAAQTYKSRPGYVATITSATEYNFTKSLITSTNTVWIALSDNIREGSWRWKAGPESGTVTTYTRWCSGQPNGIIIDQDYVHFSGSAGGSCWTDVEADDGSIDGYLIEFGDSTAFSSFYSGVMPITVANATATPTKTATSTVTNTSLPTDTPTETLTASITNTPTLSATYTPTSVVTNTAVPPATETPTVVVESPMPSATETPTSVLTNTATPPTTRTPTSVLTNTAIPPATETPTLVLTNTAIPPATRTPTLVLTNTAIPPATRTPTLVLTNTAIPPATRTPTLVLTNTAIPPATETPIVVVESPMPSATETIVDAANQDVSTPVDSFATATSTPQLDNKQDVTVTLSVSTSTPLPSITASASDTPTTLVATLQASETVIPATPEITATAVLTDSTAVVDAELDTEVALERLTRTNLSNAQAKTILKSLVGKKLSKAQAQAIASNPVLLQQMTAAQAVEVFSSLDTNALDEESKVAIINAVQDAPDEVRQAFEDEVDLFGDSFNSYVPLGSKVPIETRRALMATTVASAVIAASAARGRSRK